MNDKNLEKIQNVARSVPFIQLLDIEVTELNMDENTLTMTMPITNQISRMLSMPQIHGGAVAALIDSAATFLVIAKTETAVPTINFRIDYLKPSFNSDLTAKATLRRLGRTVAVVDVDVTDDNSVLVAIGRGTFGTGAS